MCFNLYTWITNKSCCCCFFKKKTKKKQDMMVSAHEMVAMLNNLVSSRKYIEL